eukprot:357424-Rhodomonas_salina.1
MTLGVAIQMALDAATMPDYADDTCYDAMTWMLDSDFTTTPNLNYATMLDSDALILDVNDSMVTLDVW